MAKKTYELVQLNNNELPFLEEHIDGVPWKQAKALLRKWFLDQAADLRKVSEKEYFQG